MSRRDHISFLLGAGASMNAGLPNSIQLVQKLKEDLLVGSRDGKNDALTRQQLALFLKIYRLLSGGIRFQMGTLNKDPDDSVNIEQIVIAAEELRGRAHNPIAPFVGGWNFALKELEDSHQDCLSEFIEYVYSRLTKWLSTDDNEKIAYLSRIADFSSELGDVAVATLNYDTCLEKALVDRGVEFVNGFSTERGWEPDSFYKDTPIKILKLHGSLDWIDDVDRLGLWSMEFPKSRHYEDLVGVANPLLIFGTANKMQPRDPFLTLIYVFLRILKSTRLLVIIGYSFADEHINSIIKQAYDFNASLHVMICQPSATQTVEKSPSDMSFLLNSPRVTFKEEYAKSALDGHSIYRAARNILDTTKDELPF